jgi:hypothetical protein
MSADVTVFAFVWGSTHNHFIPEWAAAIEALNIAPADVVIATRPSDPADVYGLPYRIIELESTGRTMDFLNEMLGTVKTKWIAECDIDDILLPDAFAHLDDAEGFDACANTIQFKSHGGICPSRPEYFHAKPEENHVMVNSYFTKEVFDWVGGYPTEAFFHDWALWWKLHKHGARWFPTPGVQMIYNDIPSPHKGTGNFPADAMERQMRWMASYQPSGVGE